MIKISTKNTEYSFSARPKTICKRFEAALQNNNIEELYLALQNCFDDGYTIYVEPYQVYGADFIQADYSTRGLAELFDEQEGTKTYVISKELSKALYEWNLWLERLSDAFWFDKEDHSVVDIESDFFDRVAEKLAIQVKREIPDCRVFIPKKELEFIINEKCEIISKNIAKDDIPLLCYCSCDFLFELDKTVVIDGREVDFYKTKNQ